MLCTVCCALSVAYCQTVSCALHIACCTQCALPHCTLCMLHSACILTFYTVSCATYTDCVLCVLYTACWILHTAYTAHTVFSTAHCVLCTVPGSVPRGACLEERKLPRGCQEAALRWLCPGRPGQPARPGSQSVRFPRVNTPPVGCAFDRVGGNYWLFRWPGRGESGQLFPNQFPKLLSKLATSDMELQGAGVANSLDLLHLV